MAKRRMLSQEIIYDENLNSLSIEAYYLFTRLLVVSDDFGFVPANEYTICALINPHPKIKKNIKKYIAEIVENKVGFIFTYEDKEYFSFKRETFDSYQSYVIAKRTKSDYLKLSKDFIESENFQEILGSFRKVIPDDIISIKIKDKSIKIKEEPTHILQKFILENCPNISLIENQLAHKDAEKLFQEFTEVELQVVIESMENYKPLVKKYKSVNLTMLNWLKRGRENGTNHKNSPRGTIDFSKWEREIKIARGEQPDLVSNSIQG